MTEKMWKLYLFLIVTMSLSLSFLLCFFIYTDTVEYNDNKWYFSKPKEIITLSNPNINKLDALEQKIQNEKGIVYYKYLNQGSGYESCLGREFEIYFIPNNIQTLYFDNLMSLELSSEEKISLNDNQIYVSNHLYETLPVDNNGRRYVDLPIRYIENKNRVKRYYVKECYKSTDNEEESSITLREKVFVSLNSIQANQIDYENIGVGIITNRLEEMISTLQTLGIEYNSVYELQEAAKQVMRTDVYIKTIVAIMLYILLGINIYSSFSNTLSKRKFEIGVRRAIGATKGDITLQFFIESIYIMCISILISVFLVVYILMCYKIVMLNYFSKKVTIYITTNSIITFAIMSFFMSFCFSLVFSYKATKVQIVSYLKGE